ncbi:MULTISPECIES: hypothetical protein [unclassified Bradyrhizobium]
MMFFISVLSCFLVSEARPRGAGRQAESMILQQAMGMRASLARLPMS